MNNLVIPAAGRSTRYPNMRPKWLLTHPDGKLMIEKVLDGFDLSLYEKIVITVLREHCEKHDADVILKQIYGDEISICILDEQTKDPVETVVRTIEKEELRGYVTIKDSDCFVLCDFPLDREYICGLTIREDSDAIQMQNKSFINKNCENMVIDIVEKRVVSDIICVGVFCLQVEALVETYNKIRSSVVYKHNSEMYLSHVISYLLMNNSAIHYVEVDSYADWGTLSDWNAEREKHKTYIFDIDGVVLKNVGRWGNKNWENTFEPIEDNISVLKSLSDQGAQIIFMTCRSEEHLKGFKRYLLEKNIKYHQIITNCFHAQRVIINDFAPTNPFPSCAAVSIRRNDNLGDYLK